MARHVALDKAPPAAATPHRDRGLDPQSQLSRTEAPTGTDACLDVPGERPSSAGTPLESRLRAPFERAFGRSLADVRVHSDGAAASSARQLGGRAYTRGGEIIFGSGQFQPNSASGQRLLAHELAHVVQQRKGQPADRAISSPGSRSETEADNAANSLGWGGLHARYSDVAEYSVAAGSAPARSSPPQLSQADALIQRVQLTYDDGPDSAGNTRLVLDALNAAGAKATFYLVGKRVAQGDNWRVVFDIAAAGHWLGNHAYDWNDTNDNHIFLKGTAQERAEKILQTEWAIRDALITGRADAVAKQTWASIPSANRDQIDDVIAHGTGRFRTPGFKSKPWNSDGITTLAALESANQVLAATGLRPLKTTELSKWGPDYEGVTVDSKDWEKGKTQADVEKTVKDETTSNDDSILLHSRLKHSADATPAIAADIKSKKFGFDPTVQGAMGSVGPKAGFAQLKSISSPPTAAEIASARAWLKANYLSFGPFLSGAVAIGIFQMAQQAGSAEVMAFAAEIKATTVKTPDGDIPMANWMSAYPEWKLFLGFFENWTLKKPFPKIKGLTI
jgi:peptidoglycan/xylan/chitin deacetylase (PgdA/CDA1 family)